MQKAKLVRGSLIRDLGTPIDVAINKILDNNPGMRLTQVTVIEITQSYCLLLCTFESTGSDA